MRLLTCLLLVTLHLQYASSSTDLMNQVTVQLSSLDIGHARNAARAKMLILRESGMNEENVPRIPPEKLAEFKAAFNETDVAYAYYNEVDAFEYVNLVGHPSGNTSNTISFEFGEKVTTTRIESAKLTFYLRTALDPKAQKALLNVRDSIGGLGIVATNITVPNAPTKKYTVKLNRDALEKVVVNSGNGAILALVISAETTTDDELLVLPGRLGFENHMGVILELQFSSHKLLYHRRNKRQVLPSQCKDDQLTCCPHVQTFSWEELGFSHIIAPAKFHSVICRGSCADYEYHDYKHTQHRQMIVEGTKKLCCHSVSYEMQSIIWLDERGKIAQRDIHNFYTTRCNCD